MNNIVIQQEVDNNFLAFQQIVASLPKEVWGKYALIRHGEVIEYFDTVADAVKTGQLHYVDKLFSVQKVDNTIIDLGFYSHALPH